MSTRLPPSEHPRSRYDDVNRSLERHYATLLERHGDSPLTAQYRDRPTQELRFAILNGIGPSPTASILDFGCGLGDLLGYLRAAHGFRGEYVGYDLSESVIAAARHKYRNDPLARFERRDIFADLLQEAFDYVYICGTFNIKCENSDAYIRDALRILFRAARHGLAFNLMSTYVDFFDPALHYADPESIFRFCKEELSPCVTLRHDYLIKPGTVPYEFAVYVHAVEMPPRRRSTP